MSDAREASDIIDGDDPYHVDRAWWARLILMVFASAILATVIGLPAGSGDEAWGRSLAGVVPTTIVVVLMTKFSLFMNATRRAAFLVTGVLAVLVIVSPPLSDWFTRILPG